MSDSTGTADADADGEDEEVDDADRERQKAERRRVKAVARAEAAAARLRQLEEPRAGGRAASVGSSEGDDAVWDCMDTDTAVPPRLANLDSPSGRYVSMHGGLAPRWQARDTDPCDPPCRLEFVSRSIRHLFRITYERSDELTIAALVTYLNAAVPPDKHEDFDTAEVTKTMTALHERGAFVFEGDVIRIPNL